MANKEVADEIMNLVKPALDALGIEIVELSITREKGKTVLRMLADKEYGGITIDECAKANEEIGLLLDSSGLLADSYLLEVSSPSITRPLVSQADFKRRKGKKVHILIKEDLYEKNRREFTGVVTDIDAKAVTIKTDDNKTYIFPFEVIQKAKVKLRW